MVFNIFTPFIYIASNLNVSFDILQRKRFVEERRRHWRLQESKNKRDRRTNASRLITRDTQHPSAESKTSNRSVFAKFKDQIQWALDYNQTGYLHLVLVAINITILFQQMIVSFIYSTLSWERNSVTNEYENPVLYVLESLILINFFEKLEKGRILNRLLALICVQYLILRLRSIHRRFQNAKINRHQYNKVNIVQVNMAYASELNTDLRGWLRFLIGTETHKCKTPFVLETSQGRLMKKLSSKLKKFDKIDRLYYFNLIDFDGCHASQKIFRDYDAQAGAKHQSSDRMDQQVTELQNIDIGSREGSETASTSTVIWRKLKSWFIIEAPDRLPYLPKPKHRVDPTHLRALALYYIGTTLFIVTILCIFIGAIIAKELESSSLNNQRESIWSTWWNAFKFLLQQPKYLIGAGSGSLTICVLAVNAYDNGLMAYSSILCYSRSDKVVKMLETENQFHRQLIRGFCVYLDNKNIKLHDSDFLSARNTGNQVSMTDLEKLLPEERVRKLTLIAPDGHLNSGHHSSFKIDISKFDADLHHREPSKRAFEQKHNNEEQSVFELLVAGYRAQLNIEKSLAEFNENIVYLLDLIEVLQIELDDMKTYFTTYIDLNIIFGTVTSSIAIALLIDSNSVLDLVIHVGPSLLTIAPLIYALIIGATSERSVRIKCR